MLLENKRNYKKDSKIYFHSDSLFYIFTKYVFSYNISLVMIPYKIEKGVYLHTIHYYNIL